MTGAEIALALKLADLGLVLLDGLFQWGENSEKSQVIIRKLIEEDREPTEEEISILRSESKAYSERIAQRADEAREFLNQSVGET